jgi:hypothetical protein
MKPRGRRRCPADGLQYADLRARGPGVTSGLLAAKLPDSPCGLRTAGPGSPTVPGRLAGRDLRLVRALPVCAVTLRDRSDRLRAAPGGRQRADSNDRQQSSPAVTVTCAVAHPGRPVMAISVTCCDGRASADVRYPPDARQSPSACWPPKAHPNGHSVAVKPMRVLTLLGLLPEVRRTTRSLSQPQGRS